MLVPVYDIKNCGPRHRFVANGKLVHNSDSINMQNLPSRGADANKLKKSIKAPEGHSIIDCDSAQIEARVLAWLAGQEDLITAFAEGKDVYKKMASAIYGKPEYEIDKQERFVGKCVVLGCGYGMGAQKFKDQLKVFGTDIELDESRRIVDIYRRTNDQIKRIWVQAQNVLHALVMGGTAPLGRPGVLEIVPSECAIRFPSGLLMRYTDLSFTESDKGIQFQYMTRKGPSRIYGGKVIENVCQGLARCIIAEQMLKIGQRYKVVLTVHDAIACVVRDAEVEEAKLYVEECMRWTPAWATGLPLNCESGVGKSYGDC